MAEKTLDIQIYTELRKALIDYVIDLSHPELNRFQQELLKDPGRWIGGEIARHKIVDHLGAEPEPSDEMTRRLTTLFHLHRHNVKWEQSYTQADQLVGNDMLDGYAFVELMGKWGPFENNKIRAGIGIWGPNVHYPSHYHEAEEIYIPIAGHADFTFDETNNVRHSKGEIIYIRPKRIHGFRTNNAPFIVVYVWRQGNLRETSTFT